jgi:predicted TIM-barrel fold metal-dependent hydrolase
MVWTVFIVSPVFGQDDNRSAPASGRVAVVDTHAHPLRNVRRGGFNAAAIVSIMDEHGIALTILMSPPVPPRWHDDYGVEQLAPMARQFPGRLAFAGGGNTLNPMIQATAPGAVTPAIMAEFRKQADAIVASGAAGFGEFAAEHFSSGRGRHPYESSPPDHPLFLLLADIAAQTGMPIDLHMEAVPQDMPFPSERRRAAANPPDLHENISHLIRLLQHNRQARIVWAHAGWDLTGERTPVLMRSLLRDNPNLYMSVKIDRGGARRTNPFLPEGALKPGWVELLREFPDRFMIGSDQFYDDDTSRLEEAQAFLKELPPNIARQVASENARHIYRLRQ